MNTYKIDDITYINLATHPVVLKSGDYIFEFAKNKGKKPELVSEYITLKNEAIMTYAQNIVGIADLPKEQEGVRLIVPLFIVNGHDELVSQGLRKARYDLRSPGKKVFGQGGVLLYADGLRAGYKAI